MPSITIHTSPSPSSLSTLHSHANTSSAHPFNNSTSTLPSLCSTPSGLALLEIQGTVHAPFPTTDFSASSTSTSSTQTPIGRLEFPLYERERDGESEGKWMKKVYLYVGKHQRLVGEVKKLVKAIAVVEMRQRQVNGDLAMGDANGNDEDVLGRDDGVEREELEIVEIVKYKIMFSGRPEPVGGETDGNA